MTQKIAAYEALSNEETVEAKAANELNQCIEGKSVIDIMNAFDAFVIGKETFGTEDKAKADDDQCNFFMAGFFLPVSFYRSITNFPNIDI